MSGVLLPRLLLFAGLIAGIWAADGDGDFLDGAMDNVKSALGDAGEFFTDKFEDVTDLHEDIETREDLEKRVNDTIRFLEALRSKTTELNETTTGETREAVERIDAFIMELEDFRDDVRNESITVADLKETWKTKSTRIYNDGLDKLIALAKAAKSPGVKIQPTLFLIIAALTVAFALDMPNIEPVAAVSFT